MNIYGYHFYVDEQIAAWSATFHLTEAAVLEEMRKNVRKICQEISGNSTDSGFAWNDRFDPGNPKSCHDKNEFKECLETYNRIKYMVGKKGCSHIYEGVTDSPNELENHCPYEISWHILPFKMAMPKLIFGQFIAMDVGDDAEYRMPHLTAVYPESPEAYQQVIEDMVRRVNPQDEIDMDEFRSRLEKTGLVTWKSERGGVITILEANVLVTNFKNPLRKD